MAALPQASMLGERVIKRGSSEEIDILLRTTAKNQKGSFLLPVRMRVEIQKRVDNG